MAFRVLARTILELGAELISSDGIALYELVKNAFDARSPKVTVKVSMVMSFKTYRELIEHANSLSDTAPAAEVRKLVEQALGEIGRAQASHAIKQFTILLGEPSTKQQYLANLKKAYVECNNIQVIDEEHGMSLAELDEAFLTIGTRRRLAEKEANPGQIILGEKGVGRLSAMRLGNYLTVQTATASDRQLNVLEIDWTVFSHRSDQDIAKISISPRTNGAKPRRDYTGTTITIKDLVSEWDASKLQALARSEFSKLTDPFARDKDRYRIELFFNDEQVFLPAMQKEYFKRAHATCTAKYYIDDAGTPKFAFRIDYRIRHTEMSDELSQTELLSIASKTGITLNALRELGPFNVELYWFNRGLFREQIKDPAELSALRDFVRDWGGGLMVYRDGFRVNPYGGPDDDWLRLDPRAFASQGYKLNRAQVVGRVNITSRSNPALKDQTNREGLRTSPEKIAFVELLRHLLTVSVWGFLNRTDKAQKAHVKYDLVELKEKVQDQERELREDVRQFVNDFPKAKKIAVNLDGLIQEFWEFLRIVESIKDSYEEDLEKYIHLAGMGLMVEVLVHELTRATQHAMDVVANSHHGDPSAFDATMRTLEAQFKTLEKRLRVLDPLTISGRQTKTRFDVAALVREIVESHSEQLRRHRVRVVITPKEHDAGPLMVKAVKGMFIQVIENLLNNSLYWLKTQRKASPEFEPHIAIHIDAKNYQIQFRDNGPGIPPDRRELIFEAFWTTKPSGAGKGLGLYISRQLAHYHGAELRLSEVNKNREGNLNTFVLAFPEVAA